MAFGNITPFADLNIATAPNLGRRHLFAKATMSDIYDLTVSRICGSIGETRNNPGSACDARFQWIPASFDLRLCLIQYHTLPTHCGVAEDVALVHNSPLANPNFATSLTMQHAQSSVAL